MSAESTALLSIVVPVYREERNVPEFLSRMAPILAETGLEHEIIFAMDPSPDRTEEVILEARAKDSRVKLLKLSRRFGQPMATLAGMQFSRGDAVVVMDVDLQDPPELIREMVSAWKSGSEVVFAQRRSREGETMLKRFTAWLGYSVITRFAEVEIPPNTGDFRLMSRRVVDEVVRLRETHGFLRGMVALAGFKQTSVLFDRPARFSGEGNYNRFLGSLRIGFNGVFCFSTAALRLATIAGFASIGASVLIAPFVANTLLVFAVLFLGGVQLLAVGILGEYIGRIYEEVKQRPKFIVDRAEGIDIPKQTRHS
ncbi:MAG: hypothetical protein RL088_2708 [Verrucomicrobiota bacterium]|jgi:dolichol-phosphate mannosyltransferase